MTRCTYAWTGADGVACRAHPSALKHQCKRQQPHDVGDIQAVHECKCGGSKTVLRELPKGQRTL